MYNTIVSVISVVPMLVIHISVIVLPLHQLTVILQKHGVLVSVRKQEDGWKIDIAVGTTKKQNVIHAITLAIILVGIIRKK